MKGHAAEHLAGTRVIDIQKRLHDRRGATDLVPRRSAVSRLLKEPVQGRLDRVALRFRPRREMSRRRRSWPTAEAGLSHKVCRSGNPRFVESHAWSFDSSDGANPSRRNLTIPIAPPLSRHVTKFGRRRS